MAWLHFIWQTNYRDYPFEFLFACALLNGEIFEILSDCYFGSRLKDESDGITYAIYESQWMDRDEKCKRAYRILVEYSMRPIVIYAGVLFELSLPAFVKVIYISKIFCSIDNYDW